MPSVAIYDGNPVWVSGSTPFGFYDADQDFQVDAVKAAKFCAVRLGWPLMDLELQSGSLFTCFEEAVTTYGNQVYAWKVKENYLSLEGGPTNIDANSMVVEPTLQRLIEIAKNYGTEADVGGNIPLHKGLLQLKANVQSYDLNQWAREQGVEGGIEIRRIFYEAPPAILRYFDPYAGTGTGIQSLMDAFDFGSYSPGVNFLLMPISFDLLKIQAIEFNDQVRKSAYSFRVSNNQLEIFPIPSYDGQLRIEYYKLTDKKKLNPAAANYSQISTHKMTFEATAGETVTFTHNLGVSEDLEVQCYMGVTVEGEPHYYQFSPESIDILNANELAITFQDAVSGYIIISYPVLKTTIDGTTIFNGFSSDFQVSLPEGQSKVTQKFIHTLGTTELLIQIYEDEGTSSRLIYPEAVQVVNDREVDVTFNRNTKGHIVLNANSTDLPMDAGVITNVSEVPYENPTYSKINSIGRQWIFRYTLVLAKEVLAYVRGKYQTLPIPDSEATLNQQDLLTDARTEKDKLLQELNDLLDTSSRQSQLERKANEAEYLRKTLGGVPMTIFIG